jgi:hypothetical protein
MAELLIKIFVAAIVAAFTGVFSPAHAAYDECAVVLKTPDSFLALRDKPTTQSKLILKLKRGDVLQVDKSVKKGSPKWTWVSKQIDGIIEETLPFKSGFVSSRYIQRFQCPDAAEGIGF